MVGDALPELFLSQTGALDENGLVSISAGGGTALYEILAITRNLESVLENCLTNELTVIEDVTGIVDTRRKEH